MSWLLFIPGLPVLRHRAQRKKEPQSARNATCSAIRVALLPLQEPSNYLSPAIRRSARVSILTDFSSNPIAAVADRASDPLSAAMLITAALTGCLFSLIARRPTVVSDARVLPEVTSDSGGDETADDSVTLDSASKTLIATSGENAIWLNMRFVEKDKSFLNIFF